MPQLSHRVSLFTDSVIRRMTRICMRYDAINLSQGFPDFPPPKELTDALKRVADAGPHQYAVTFGAQDFREALAAKQLMMAGHQVDPDTEIVVTCGSTEAMMCAMMAVCNPGDKVIVFSPFYENYGADAILCGATPIYVPLVPPQYNFDPDALRRAFEQRPKALILCNPSNPSGKVFTRQELTLIGNLAKEFDAFVITDEVYEHIVYPPHQHICLATLPGMKEHTIVCNSLSKTYSITGWRLGYLLGPARVVEAARKVHDFLTVGAASPLQAAAVTGLRMGPAYYQALANLYLKKRDLLLQGLREVGLKHSVPQGTYFVMVDIGDFLSQPRFAGMDDVMFCEWMAQHIGVGAVPGSSFFREDIHRYIRLHFARSEDTLKESIRRLGRLTS
ncbi:MAG: pyridoxal phosphate-dependent aminotransferase [Christensenellales bacterium]|jgi:aspartate/methionine/tyrosine aminotransferase